MKLVFFSNQIIFLQRSQWRRQVWGTGARAPSPSKCLIFLVTSEPHKLWHWTLCDCPPGKYTSL